MRERVKCFDEVFDRKKPHSILDAGLRVIDVKRITGTVDKCGELDSNFRYIKRRDRGERSRRFRLEEAARRYHFFPPIEVLLHKGFYYVVDGNRRVSAAKEMKVEYIDAHVKEYIHKGDVELMSGALSRRRFEVETELKNINLLYESGYSLLRDEIADSVNESTDMRAAAKRWYSSAFMPACVEIEKSELRRAYPELVAGDIFVLITRFYRDFLGGVPKEVGFQTLISGYMFAHRIPQRRVLRFFPFNMLGALIIKKGTRGGYMYSSGERRV